MRKPDIRVIAPGETVTFYADGPAARVVEVAIAEGDCVHYRVVWFNGGSRCDEWVEAGEVKHRQNNDALRTIGFHSGESAQ